MDRHESSRLGDLQSEGNLGNERNRNTGRGRSGEESVVNRSDEGSTRDRDREERGSAEEWSPTSDTGDNNDARRGGGR
jgi:hypothetical protein